MTLPHQINQHRGRITARRPSTLALARCRSRSADNVCVTVNTPRRDPATYDEEGGPSPGDQNDLQNILFLAERENDDFDSNSCPSDDDSSSVSGSSSDDSEAREDEHLDSFREQTVVMTDKLRKLASNMHTVQKVNHEAQCTQSMPVVDVTPASPTAFAAEETKPIVGTCLENSADDVCLENGKFVNGYDDAASNFLVDSDFEKSQLGVGPFTEQNEQPRTSLDFRSHEAKFSSAEGMCSEDMKFTSTDDAEVLNIGASDNGILVPKSEPGLLTNEHDEMSNSDTAKPVISPCIVENADCADGLGSSPSVTVVVVSDSEEGEEISSETVPPGYVMQCIPEGQILPIGDGDASFNLISMDSSKLSRRGGVRPLQTSPECSVENQVDEMQDFGSISVVVEEAEEDLFYTDTELDAVMMERRDAEHSLEQKDTLGDELWPRREPNYVLRLARAYSSRVKEISASASTPRRGREVPDTRPDFSKRPSVLSRFPLMSDYEVSPPVSPTGDTDIMDRWYATRIRAKSVDELANFPQTSVRETIRKLKQKVSSGNFAQDLSPVSESVHLLGENAEDNQQGSFVRQKRSVPRQPGTLIRERLRVFDGGSGTTEFS